MHLGNFAVLEYVEGNGIRNLSEIQGHIDETTARRYFKDIITGLTYLHSHVSIFLAHLPWMKKGKSTKV